MQLIYQRLELNIKHVSSSDLTVYPAVSERRFCLRWCEAFSVEPLCSAPLGRQRGSCPLFRLDDEFIFLRP